MQLVLQHCHKPSWMAMLCILRTTFHAVLQETRLQGLFSRMVIQATSLFNSSYSHVAKKIACFLLPVFMNHESGRKSWIIEVKNDRNHEYQDSASNPEKFVNSNNFLFRRNNCLNVALTWILVMQHLNTQNVIRRGLQLFRAHSFGGGRIFGLLTWEGLKFLGSHFWNNTAPLPAPSIVIDCSLKGWN